MAESIIDRFLDQLEKQLDYVRSEQRLPGHGQQQTCWLRRPAAGLERPEVRVRVDALRSGMVNISGSKHDQLTTLSRLASECHTEACRLASPRMNRPAMAKAMADLSRTAAESARWHGGPGEVAHV